MMRRMLRNRKGQGLVEYALIIAGVALICAAAVSVFGHKTSDLVAAVAAVLPGAHPDDNAAITAGKLIETTAGGAGAPIQLDVDTIVGNAGTARLDNNVLGAGGSTAGEGFGGLVLEAP